MALSVVQGGSFSQDQIVAEAYGHVVEGLRRALDVPGLPGHELADLQGCYRAACAIVIDMGGDVPPEVKKLTFGAVAVGGNDGSGPQGVS